jgi:ribonuclease P protein component
VYRQGKSVTARFLRLYFAPNRIKHFRLGVVVSKRISKKAVERNWHKRLIKEWFRQHALLASREQSDIVIVVIKAACATPRGSAELRKELAVLVQQVFK